MLRLSKMADYGIVLMTYIAHTRAGETSTARDLAEQSGLPLPTVSKVLKALARAELLSAHRGKHGGYTLAQTPNEVTVAAMISAVDGPIALTECVTVSESLCEIETSCPTRNNWSIISQTVRNALSELTLADLGPSAPCAPSTFASTESRLEVVG